MKRGDIVIVKVSSGDFFDVGDKARLLGDDPESLDSWEGDFNGMGNRKVVDGGKWWFASDEVEIYQDQDPEEVLP